MAEVATAPATSNVGERGSVDGEEDELYIKTQTHNFVSRGAVIQGANCVELKGRSIVDGGCTIRGDLAFVRIGRYCRIRSGTLLEPAEMVAAAVSAKANRGGNKFVPLTVGSHSTIGSDCRIRAAAVGSQCWIGDRVKLGKRVIIKDCCIVADDVVLGDDTVIPPFTRVAPSPSRPELRWTAPALVELPPSTAQEMQERTMETYQDFAAQQSALQRTQSTKR